MSSQGSFWKNSFVLALGTGLSRVFGLARDILLASVLAAGVQADAFVAAFRLPNLFRRLFAEGAFAAGFVPVYASLSGEARQKFAAQILSLVSLFLLCLTLLAEIFMEELVFALVGGFVTDLDKFALAILCSRITFPYLICMFLVSLYGALLNVASRFWATALVPILLNLCLIGFALLIWFQEQTAQAAFLLSWGVGLSGFLQAAMIIRATSRAGLFVLPQTPRLTSEVKKFLSLIGPALIAGGVVQFNILIGTRIASVQESAVAQLYYAERLYQLPLAMIGIAIGVALLPALAQLHADKVAMGKALSSALEGAMLLTLPATFALFLLAEPIIAALFEYGAFGADLRVSVALILAAFALGLPAFVGQRILVSAFFAYHDTRAPLYFALLALVANMALSLWWFPIWGAVGIALATAVAATAQTLGLGGVAIYRGWFVGGGLALKFMGQVAASALMGSALYFFQSWQPLPDDGFVRVIYLFALVLLGLLVYFVLCPAIKLINIKTMLKEFYVQQK